MTKWGSGSASVEVRDSMEGEQGQEEFQLG